MYSTKMTNIDIMECFLLFFTIELGFFKKNTIIIILHTQL